MTVKKSVVSLNTVIVARKILALCEPHNAKQAETNSNRSSMAKTPFRYKLIAVVY